MDETSRGFPPGDIRVSDADRDRALAELGEALRVGRITADEFDERSGLALRSRTGLELTGLLADLPPTSPPATLADPRSGRPAPGVRRVMTASAVAASVLAFSSVAHALQPGLTLQQREQIQAIAASQGLSIPLPANPGLAWPGIVIPAILAVLFAALVIYLQVTRVRRRA
jgi:Domain of unknown function (DUF1707)